MAQKSKSAQKSSVKWISVELTKQQAADMKKLMPDAQTIFDGALKLTEAGYKFTLRWDEWNKCHACYCFADEENGANSGYCLTARGASPQAALRGVLYRHFVLFDQTWGDREHEAIDED